MDASQRITAKKLRVFFVCSGLGRVNRGYESFMRECFEALVDNSELSITLFQGGGKNGRKQKTLWNLHRNSHLAKILGRLLRKDGYIVEQLSFVLMLIPHIARVKPHVIYFSDGFMGNMLHHWRRLSRRRYRLLFSNGGPQLPPFPYYDKVQEVTLPHYQKVLQMGEDDSKCTLLPYGIKMKNKFSPLSPAEKTHLREQLGLPADRALVISVGALNTAHKRMDYLISEISKLPTPRPFLLLLGQEEEETPFVRDLALKTLEPNNFAIKTVAPHEIGSYYKASDIFVLASLAEGFGRVFLEAMSNGLPCLAHDTSLTHYVLGEYGYYADFREPGALASLVQEVLPSIGDETLQMSRQQYIYEKFSWEKLQMRYVELIHSTGKTPL